MAAEAAGWCLKRSPGPASLALPPVCCQKLVLSVVGVDGLTMECE